MNKTLNTQTDQIKTELQATENKALQTKADEIANIALSGSKSEEFMMNLFQQMKGSLWLCNETPESYNQKITAMLTSVTGIKPEGELEGMMAAQMIATHNAAMECFKRSMIDEQPTEIRMANIAQANKLVRSYATLTDALIKHRNKGALEQKVTVQHVHVNGGGQAIIGDVKTS